MKIVQIIPTFDYGGAEIMVENLLYGLKEKGHDVLIFCMSGKKSAIATRIEDKGIKIIYFNKKAGFRPNYVFKIYNLLKKEKPDVVHTHLHCTVYAFPAAVMAKVKVITHTLHNIVSKECSVFHQKFNGLFYRRFGVIPVALSEEIKETAIDTYKLKTETVPVIYNGINMDFVPEKKIYEYRNPAKIVHVGRFAHAKNHINLIRSFRLLLEDIPECELTLVGDGELRQDIENEIKKNGLCDKVHLIGITDDVYRYLIDSDVFVLPSIHEGMPMTVIEAMCVGIPIVATDVGGISEMVQDGISALFCQTTPESICSAVKNMIRSEELRIQLSARAKKDIHKFTSEYMASNYMKLYTKILSEKRGKTKC